MNIDVLGIQLDRGFVQQFAAQKERFQIASVISYCVGVSALLYLLVEKIDLLATTCISNYLPFLRSQIWAENFALLEGFTFYVIHGSTIAFITTLFLALLATIAKDALVENPVDVNVQLA